jgi:leader peptidase (prepilin peptidase)/N-methyltransferase
MPPFAWVPLLAATVVSPPAAWIAHFVSVRLSGDAAAPPLWAALAATLTAFLWAALISPPLWLLAVSLGLGWVLLCLAAVDIAAFRLPDVLTLPLTAAGLVVAALLPGRPILDHLAGAAVGWGLLAGLALAYRRWRKIDGLGLGDAKLLAAAGAWLGWQALPSVLLIGCLIAFAWVAARRVRQGRQSLAEPIAFGAPLALAFWIVWLHGPLRI